MTRFVQSYPEEAMILLDVMALATNVGIFCSGIRQNSCASNELQDFWQSPLRFDYVIHHHLSWRDRSTLHYDFLYAGFVVPPLGGIEAATKPQVPVKTGTTNDVL